MTTSNDTQIPGPEGAPAFGLSIDQVDTLNDNLSNIVSLSSLVANLMHIDACGRSHLAQLRPEALSDTMNLLSRLAEEAQETLEVAERVNGSNSGTAP